MSARDFWINQAFFQLSWPACVIGAANGMLWPGALVVGLFAIWQLHPARRHRRDLVVVGAFVATGLILDTIWVRTGVVEYATAWPAPGFIPVWLLLLWVSTGLTVNHSLSVFKSRWRAFMLLATVGSPLSYTAAAKFGAVTWLAPTWVVIICLGPVWALIVALLFRQAGQERSSRKSEAQAAEAARG